MKICIFSSEALPKTCAKAVTSFQRYGREINDSAQPRRLPDLCSYFAVCNLQHTAQHSSTGREHHSWLPATVTVGNAVNFISVSVYSTCQMKVEIHGQ